MTDYLENHIFDNKNLKIFGSMKIGEKGQVVIPQKIRKQNGLNPGDSILFFYQSDNKTISFIKNDDIHFLSNLTNNI